MTGSVWMKPSARLSSTQYIGRTLVQQASPLNLSPGFEVGPGWGQPQVGAISAIRRRRSRKMAYFSAVAAGAGTHRRPWRTSRPATPISCQRSVAIVFGLQSASRNRSFWAWVRL
ncbi:MAG: hypothetical protein MZV64_34325 [Ignavibacteriales bacterium]|nr:hypothetical protein [Ignavibacteriales bacterium]